MKIATTTLAAAASLALISAAPAAVMQVDNGSFQTPADYLRQHHLRSPTLPSSATAIARESRSTRRPVEPPSPTATGTST